MQKGKIYNKDFVIWVEEQASALKKRQFNQLDFDNLIEEIEDMGKSEKRSLESYLERLIEHILKIEYWEAERANNYQHWNTEIKNFRNRIDRLLKRSPSLKRYMVEIYPELFADVVDAWSDRFDFPKDLIPLEKILK